MQDIEEAIQATKSSLGPLEKISGHADGPQRTQDGERRMAFRNFRQASAKAVRALKIVQEQSQRIRQSTSQKVQVSLDSIQTALIRDGEHRGMQIEEMLFGRSVPITWVFLLNAYAFVQKQYGNLKMAETLFKHCIREDPGFSESYLNLGECYLTRSKSLGGQDIERKEQYKRLSRLCVRIAKYMEGRTKSRTKQRATELLKDDYLHRRHSHTH